MSGIKELVKSVLLNDCPVEKVSKLIENIEVSDNNDAAVEEAVNLLKIHETEIRKLRQDLATKLMNHKMEKFKPEKYFESTKK
jgi:hypothetical protein